MQKRKDEQNENRGITEFEVFYRTHYEGIYNYVHSKTLDVQMTEDIVQETFCIAYVKRQDLLEHSEPQLWLLRTAKYKILELNRKMRYRITVPLEERLELGREELCYKLKELELTALAILSKDEWRIVKDHYMYGVTISELAKSKGISQNTMGVRLDRLKKKLRKDIL